MGFRQRFSEWIRNTKDTLDFGPEFPAALASHRLTFTKELTRLQYLLEEARRAAQEKDELIARLRAQVAIISEMVFAGPAYFIRKLKAFDGPYCTRCFQQDHKAVRIVSAPLPEGGDASTNDWVQCVHCRTAFRSELIGPFLNPGRTAPAAPRDAAGPAAPDTEGPTAGKAKKPHPPTRRPKRQRSEPQAGLE
jgi:hypothetical protein